MSLSQAKEIIDSFFKKESFSQEELKKIKRLAMKHQIKLGVYRKNFCKKCLSKIKGKITINKDFKTIECASCGYKNRYKLS